jgi:hypothetical protein
VSPLTSRVLNHQKAAFLLTGLFLSLLASSSLVLAQSSGPVAAYNFNEGSGTTVTDLSGNGITGTIVGASWTASGRYGNGLSFNGSSSYVDLGNPAALQFTGSLTLEAWVMATANPPDDGQIIAKSNDIGWQFKTTPDTGKETFGVAVSGSSNTKVQRYSSTVRALNTWYHVAGVYNAAAGTLDIYVNGILDSGSLVGVIPPSQFNQTVNVNIGRRTGGFYFNGIIDEVRIYNRALSQAEIQSDMNTPIGGTPPPPDTTPPTVSITAPLDGATVTGTTTLSASASDNVGVAGVQFLLDGSKLGSQISSSPYIMQWNTATASPGPHTISATATDFSGNIGTSSNIGITVTGPSPAQVGQWSAVMPWPIVAVHAMLLPTGNVLAWTDYTDNAGAQIWRPSTNTFTPETYSLVSLFCSGESYMADGRVLIAGGIVGLQDDLGPRNATIFDPTTESWSQGSMMNTGRYYPTSTTLSDGRILVQGGTTTCVTCIADMPEIYDPVKDVWTQLAASARLAFKYYPHDYLLPDGRVLTAAEDDKAIATRVLDLNTQAWTVIDSRIIDGHSSAMYLPGKIIKAGTATADNPGHPSAATTYVLDMTQPSPAWQATSPMAYPRSFLNLTVLPDGEVLATGGGTTTDPANFAVAVYPAELWSPISKTWSTMSAMQTPRLYHSTALLLPDARVLVAGGGRQNGRSQPDPADEPNAEIFSPPYLFKGARPVISSAPPLLAYGSPFSVITPDAARIASVSLIALGTVTHAFNENQRFVPLSFDLGGGSLNVHGPVDGNTAPPGPYMLFLVDTNGVPSQAAMVRLPAPGEDTQPPTAPGNLAAITSTGAASLTWTASTDNIGVTAYNVYRSTTSGFSPLASNKIAQVSGTAYTDTSFSSAGTYYYLVAAQDAKGNLSGASNEASANMVLDVTPPTISISSPVEGSTVSGVVTVMASATDDVAVAGVQFLLDGSPLGAEVTGTGPNYSIPWTSSAASNGSHTLSAKARDGAGNTTQATDVHVTVSNLIPSGLVAAYSFSEGSGTTVSDTSGNNLKGTIVGATWVSTGKYGPALSFNGTSSYIDLGNPTALQFTGSMTVEAWVNASANPADDGQIVAKSDGTGWQFKTTPDTGAETFGMAVSSGPGSNIQRYSTTVRSLNVWYHVAGVYDAVAQTLSTYVNGVLDNGILKGVVPGSQFNQSVNVNIGRRTGGYYFKGLIDEVRIYNRALSQPEIQNDMNTPIGAGAPPDTTPPSVSLTAPSSGANLNGTVTISASATDNTAMAGVQFLLDGANLGAEVTGSGPTYSFTWNTSTASNGPHTISARARDTSNNVATSATVPVNVSNPDTTPPSVLITLPVAGATVSGTTSITASASDNVAMAGVQFLLDGANLAAEVTGTGPTYSLSWDTTTAGNGPHTLAARARDTSNNTAVSSNVSITVSNGDNVPPTVSITAPNAGSTVTGIISVTASASDNVAVAGVQFLLDGAALGSEVTGSGPIYSLSWNTASGSNGSHTLSARARDGVGNTSLAANVIVTVSNAAPSGLIAAYSFNQGSGTTAVDSSGNGITGTLSGATWTNAGEYGDALSFNGTNNYVNLGNPKLLQGTGSMTWAAWVKATGNPPDDAQIIAKSNGTSGWQFKTSPDTGPETFAISVTGSGGTVQRYSNTIRSLNTWYHVAGVYNATTKTLDIYVNGVLDDGILRGTTPSVQTGSTVNANIGRRSTGFYFKGTIDEVRIFNRALSQSEIQAIMGTPLP